MVRKFDTYPSEDGINRAKVKRSFELSVEDFVFILLSHIARNNLENLIGEKIEPLVVNRIITGDLDKYGYSAINEDLEVSERSLKWAKDLIIRIVNI